MADWKTVPTVNGKATLLDGDAAPASHVNSRDGHPPATQTDAGFMSAESLARLQAFRSYQAPGWIDYTYTAVTGWQSTPLPNPVITVPALGPTPSGFEWRIDVVGSIRMHNPATAQRSYFFAVGFDGAASTSVQGGGDIPANFQAALPLVAYNLVPPAADRDFTVNITLWINNAADVSVRLGPLPVAKTYLAAV